MKTVARVALKLIATVVVLALSIEGGAAAAASLNATDDFAVLAGVLLTVVIGFAIPMMLLFLWKKEIEYACEKLRNYLCD